MSSNDEQATIRPNKYNRNFSEAFRKERVKAILNKQLTIAQTSRIYEVSPTSIYKWIYRYSDQQKGTRTVVEMKSEGKIIEGLYARLAELERVVGQKQMALDIAERTIDLASQEVGFDLKKKYAAISSSTIVSTPKITPTK